MVTEITCGKRDILLVNYEAPDGSKKHNRLWNGGTGKGRVSIYKNGKIVDDMTCENTGCEYGEYDA